MVAEIEKERRREREERNERLRWLRAEGWSGLKILGQNIVAFYFYAREYMHKCIRDPRDSAALSVYIDYIRAI